MKKTVIIMLILCISFNSFFLFLNNTNAVSSIATITDSDGVNVRNGAGTNYGVVGFLSYKNSATLISTTKYSGVGCDDGWYKINYNGSTSRYICSTYTKVSTSSTTLSSSSYYTSEVWTARTNENMVNIRSGAGTGYSVKNSVYLGTDLEIIGSTTNWYKVNYYDDKTGYVSKSLVDVYGDKTLIDEEYNKVLDEEGFPSSYWPYLSYLHKKYPNWKFKAIKTNKYFNTAVTKETGKNYIQSKIDSYRQSSVIKEKPNWYGASSGVIAFYLDPRTYLNEKNIFVFEDLSYDEVNHTSDIIGSIFDGTYLDTTTYIGYYMKAAKTYNISPIHLASRTKQEGGTNKTYAAVSGTVTSKWNNKTLKGFYNYYNIGAYGDNPVLRGLAVAAGYVDNYDGTPWNTRYKAIMYGAKFISDGYINAGQNTLYFQKFNTGPNSDYTAYSHQYMTNVTAPTSEANSSYEAYNELKILDKSLSFSIPVYTDMPESHTTLPPVGDTNNSLSDLKIDGQTIANFDSDVLSYTKYINNNTLSIDIDAVGISNVSKVTGDGQIKIENDTTEVKITVTPQVGLAKVYKITLIKLQETTPDKALYVDEIMNKLNIKFSDDYLTGIKIGNTNATIASMIEKIEPTAKVTILTSNNSTKTGKLVTGDILKITSNEETKDFTISLKGDTNGDGKINSVDLLRIQKHILGYSKLTNSFKESADVNYDGKINSIDLLRTQKHILGYIEIK